MADSRDGPVPTGTLTLDDGRILAWDEHGPASGPAVILMHGAPACRVGWKGTVRIAEESGVRLVVPDRPGCGRSTFAPGRRIADWPADVRALVDRLGLESYAVAGESGGGPYALACAFDADPRLTRTAVICGVGPLDTPEAIPALDQVNRAVFEAAAAGPEATVPLIAAMAAPPTSGGQDAVSEILARLAPEDRAALAEHPDLPEAGNVSEAAALGPEGPAYDLWLYTRPWGFDLGAIDVPVDFYAGDHDRNVPLQHAVDQAAAVPTSTLTVWQASGHLAGLLRMGEVFNHVTAR